MKPDPFAINIGVGGELRAIPLDARLDGKCRNLCCQNAPPGMPALTNNPVAVRVILFAPAIVNPSWALPTKYKPLVVSPVKFNDGDAAVPLLNVRLPKVLDVAVWAL